MPNTLLVFVALASVGPRRGFLISNTNQDKWASFFFYFFFLEKSTHRAVSLNVA